MVTYGALLSQATSMVLHWYFSEGPAADWWQIGLNAKNPAALSRG